MEGARACANLEAGTGTPWRGRNKFTPFGIARHQCAITRGAPPVSCAAHLLLASFVCLPCPCPPSAPSSSNYLSPRLGTAATKTMPSGTPASPPRLPPPFPSQVLSHQPLPHRSKTLSRLAVPALALYACYPCRPIRIHCENCLPCRSVRGNC